MERRIGVIGGSGLYDMEDLKEVKRIKVDTPFGEPSDEYVMGKLEGREVVFLPRHGKGHRILPSELNYRANIYGFKKLGVEWIISVSSVGSFKEGLRPLDILIPDQFFDRTNQARKYTFFGEGVVAHIAFSEPVCPNLSEILYAAGVEKGFRMHKGGTYLNMEGPAFSTRAESRIYKSWGVDIIGMTNMPEARLAREAEICYATMALITDYDSWKEKEEGVVVEMVMENLRKNVHRAKEILREAVKRIPEERNCLCARALENAVITRSNLIPRKTKEKLALIMGKYIR